MDSIVKSVLNRQDVSQKLFFWICVVTNLLTEVSLEPETKQKFNKKITRWRRDPFLEKNLFPIRTIKIWQKDIGRLPIRIFVKVIDFRRQLNKTYSFFSYYKALPMNRYRHNGQSSLKLASCVKRSNCSCKLASCGVLPKLTWLLSQGSGLGSPMSTNRQISIRPNFLQLWSTAW